MNPIVGRDLLVDEGIKLLRQCLIGRGLNRKCLVISFVSGKLQQFASLPKSFNGFASLEGPFSAGRVNPGYTLRVVDCFVDVIATRIDLKLRGHETNALLIVVYFIRMYT
jgi:hypothetical protein